MRNRENVARFRADATAVARRVVDGPETIAVVAAEYGVGLRFASQAIRPHATAAEVTAAARRKLAALSAGRRPPVPARFPVGTVRVFARQGEPYRAIKVRNGGPTNGRWVALARWRYERAFGRVPTDHHVVPVNGDRMDDRLENLVARRLNEKGRVAFARRPELRLRKAAAVSASKRRAEDARRQAGLVRRYFAACDACGHDAPGRRLPAACLRCGGRNVRLVERYLPLNGVAPCRPAEAPRPAAASAPPDPRVAAHIPLAQRIAGRMHARMPRHVELGDVESAAVAGLYAACRTYDPAGGASFRTHAASKVRFAILSWQQAQPPNDLAWVQPVEDVGTAAAEPSVEADELWRRVLRSVPARHARLLRFVYRDGLNQREAGDRIGVSEPRASQLHAEAVARLRRRWTEAELAEALGLPAAGRRAVA